MALNDAMNSRKDYHEVPPEIDVAEFRKVVESRRSIRRYLDENIPTEIMNECFRLAHLAPSSSNLQPWEFLWVRTQKIKDELAQHCMAQPAAVTAPELIVCLARTDKWRSNAKEVLKVMENAGAASKSVKQYYGTLIPTLMTTSPLLSPVKWLLLNTLGLFRPIVRGPIGFQDKKIWAIKSAAFACENLMLALRAHGYDSCPMEGFDECRVRRLLKIPRGAQIVMVLSAGKRVKGGVYGKQLRLPLKNFVKEL